jgi:radical SAM enzyme (rSAM/lipoprotein system)
MRLGLRKRLALDLFAKYGKLEVRDHTLRQLFWESTLRCCLNCRHCGSECTAQETAPDMPLADFLRVLDEEVTPHTDPHRVMIILSGGDPLMRPDLETCGLEVYKRGYPWGLVTNGMLLDRSRFDGLLRAGLHSISISLDGFEAEHNALRGHPESFARAVDAIRMVVREPSIIYDIITCVTPALFPKLPEFKEFLISEGVTHWRLATIFPAGRAATDSTLQLTDEQKRLLMEFIRDTRREGRINASFGCEGFLGGFESEVRDHFYWCIAGVNVASVRIDGSISGCTSIRHNFTQGNIYTDRFWDVWENRFQEFRDRSWARTGACATCEAFKYCLGGGMHQRGDAKELIDCLYLHLKG